MITLGNILDELQADYIPNLTELKAVRRSVGRVVSDFNSKMSGIDVFDLGLQMIVESTTESVAFNVAAQKATLTTTPTATILPGDVLVVYDSDYNNHNFNIAYADSAVIYITPEKPVFEETKSCTYAIYRPWRNTLVKNVVMTDLTYVNVAKTITSAGGELDFLELGLKSGDFFSISGATEASNNSMLQVDSVTATVITVKLLGKSGFLADDANDPGIITIYGNIDDAYGYDLENHRVSIPISARKFLQMYEGNITGKADPKSDSFVADSDNDEEVVFSTTARNRYTLSPEIFQAADDILTFKVKRDLVAPVSSYRDVEVEIPQAFEYALKKGVLQDLLQLPKYSNKDMLKEQRVLYSDAILELFQSEEERNRSTIYERDYNW